MSKQCTRCECHGPFNPNPSGRDGLHSLCRECQNAANRARYHANRKKESARKRLDREQNPDKYRERGRKYTCNNREKIKKYQRQYRQENIEKYKEKEREYRINNANAIKEYKLQNRDAIAKQKHRHYVQNRREIIDRNIAYYNQLPEEKRKSKQVAAGATRRARIAASGGGFTSSEWDKLKVNYNFTCLACNKSEPEIKLEADHIQPVSKGGTSNIENIQPLCSSCNRSKGTKEIDYRPQCLRI